MELKPCPFCNNQPSIMFLKQTLEEPSCWIINCGGSDHDISVYDDLKEKAIEIWNRQPTGIEPLDVEEIIEAIYSSKGTNLNGSFNEGEFRKFLKNKVLVKKQDLEEHKLIKFIESYYNTRPFTDVRDKGLAKAICKEFGTPKERLVELNESRYLEIENECAKQYELETRLPMARKNFRIIWNIIRQRFGTRVVSVEEIEKVLLSDRYGQLTPLGMAQTLHNLIYGEKPDHLNGKGEK